MKYLLWGLALSAAMTTAAMAASNSLYENYAGKIVKISFGEFKNSSEEASVSADALRQKLQEALKNRHSITFEFVDQKEKADLELDANIRSFTWTDHDPVDMLFGLGGTAADAAVVEDYARLEAYWVVREVKTNRTVWQDSVAATVTKKPMPKADSVPLVTDELAKEFVKVCFGKKRGR